MIGPCLKNTIMVLVEHYEASGKKIIHVQLSSNSEALASINFVISFSING